MPVPAVRRLVLAGAPALLACALVAPPAAAAPSVSTAVVRTVIGPAPAVGDPMADETLVLVSQITAEPVSLVLDRGNGPLFAVGAAVVALMGAFVAGLSRRPDPVD